MKNSVLIFATLLILAGRAACAATLITHGADAPAAETHAAAELAADLQRVCGESIKVSAEPQPQEQHMEQFQSRICLGTLQSSACIRSLAEMGLIDVQPGAPDREGFILKSLADYPGPGQTTLAIAGGEPRGVLYGAYEFSEKQLGVDPNEFWTGKQPPACAAFSMPADLDVRVPAPVFPLRGYFDNDDDMIANWRGKKLIIEFDTWKEIIDSLARMRYNYIDLHDTLGRAEFWNWPYYLTKFPGYETDVELVGQIIDYAHSKGMLVQIPMYLGWQFHHLPEDKFCLSKYHADWMAVYEYYLTQSPIGKADLFLQRPRDPWWDRAYRCQEEADAGTPPGPLMTDMFNGLRELVSKHTKNGKVICDLWAEGRAMWAANQFNPDAGIDMLWADGGYANYSTWPEDIKGHKFGIYIHAGYYLNHVMQDPYPALIRDAALEAVRRGFTANYFVNGQDYKHFILNLEAAGRAGWDPQGFDPEAFYLEWAARYFGADAAPVAVQHLKKLHEAHQPLGGFAKISGRTMDLLNALRVLSAYTGGATLEDAENAYALAQDALALAEQAASLAPPEAQLVFDDQILFPAQIFLENVKLHLVLAHINQAFADSTNETLAPEQRKEAKKQLATWKKRAPAQLSALRDLLAKGSSWDKWAGWTHPDNFRKITPPPAQDDLERVMRTLP